MSEEGSGSYTSKMDIKGSVGQLNAVAARVLKNNPQLDVESVQIGVSAALQEVYALTHERRQVWSKVDDRFSKAREAEACSLGQLVFQLHGG